MNRASSWSVQRRSNSCQIRTRFGDFAFSAYELVDLDGRLRSVVTLSRGTLRDGVLVRVNSGCVTGDVFGDLSCDCGWQLAKSLEMIALEGSGLLIYAPFEDGRGAGIVDKSNSMALMQVTGMSSSRAFVELELPLDTRDYGYAGVIICELGLRSVRCITNNPKKVASLVLSGIIVESTVEIIARERSDLRDFYIDKVVAQGHRIHVPDESRADGPEEIVLGE